VDMALDDVWWMWIRVREQYIVIAIYCNTIHILKGVWMGFKTIAICMEGISSYNNIAIYCNICMIVYSILYTLSTTLCFYVFSLSILYIPTSIFADSGLFLKDSRGYISFFIFCGYQFIIT
jgi:hypothetical protein